MGNTLVAEIDMSQILGLVMSNKESFVTEFLLLSVKDA